MRQASWTAHPVAPLCAETEHETVLPLAASLLATERKRKRASKANRLPQSNERARLGWRDARQGRHARSSSRGATRPAMPSLLLGQAKRRPALTGEQIPLGAGPRGRRASPTSSIESTAACGNASTKRPGSWPRETGMRHAKHSQQRPRLSGPRTSGLSCAGTIRRMYVSGAPAFTARQVTIGGRRCAELRAVQGPAQFSRRPTGDRGLFAACQPLFSPRQIRRRNRVAQRGSIRTG